MSRPKTNRKQQHYWSTAEAQKCLEQFAATRQTSEAINAAVVALYHPDEKTRRMAKLKAMLIEAEAVELAKP